MNRGDVPPHPERDRSPARVITEKHATKVRMPGLKKSPGFRRGFSEIEMIVSTVSRDMLVRLCCGMHGVDDEWLSP